MGLGGYLMWTAVGKEISKVTKLKMLPIESHGHTIKFIDSEAFHNNSDFIQPGEKFTHAFPLVLNNPKTNYCKKDTPEKAVHRYDKHVIGQICEAYGIENPDLKCRLHLTELEKSVVDDILLGIGDDDFIAIEPHSKTNYTPNRAYPFEKWQLVVDELSRHIKVVQVGQRTEKVLKNCINLTGSTTFREAAGIIENAKMLLCSEGGLMHVANAMSTKSLVIVTGYQSPIMTCYPENINLWVNNGHGPCGLKMHCEKCSDALISHDPYEIINSVISELKI